MSPRELILFVVLFFLSAFFSGSEIALMSIPSHKIEVLIKQGKKRAKILKNIKKNSDKLLITILIGNNLVNVYTAALATKIAINMSKNLKFAESLAIGIATGVVTFLLLMFGEIIPKSFAVKNSEKISLFVAPIYSFLMKLLFPFIVLIELITKLFTGKTNQTNITEDEICSIIDIGKNEGALEDDEHKQLKGLLQLNKIQAGDIMIPRVKIEKLKDEYTVQQAIDFILSHSHSRIPVYHEDADNIIGFVTLRFLIQERRKGNGEKKLADIKLLPILKVPLTKPLDDLLEKFRNSHMHLAIVVDEYGGVAGLITLEDVIEEVFGDIQDETDKEDFKVKKLNNGKLLVRGDILLQKLLQELNLSVDEIEEFKEKDYENETINFVILDILERFPEKGEKIEFDLIIDEEEKQENQKLVFEITKFEDGAIEEVQVWIDKISS